MNKKHHMVNWVDGMKIRKQHFIDQQKAVSQQMMEGVASRLNAINYGLLPPASQHEEPSYSLNIEIENTETIHAKIFRCKATTPGGFIIDIGDASGQPRDFAIAIPSEAKETETQQRFALVLSASPYTYHEIGDADPEEVPPRKPFVEPTYQLGLIPRPETEDEISPQGLMDLAIGEIMVDASHIQLNEDFIPPSMAVYSCTQLIEYHTQFYHSLRKLETLCVNIIRKVVTKDQGYLLAQIVKQISEDILAYLGSTLHRFDNALRYEPPVAMVEHIASLGRLLRNAIDIHQGAGKEELINYFVEWCDINQGTFERVIRQVVDHRYNHHAIAEATHHCDRFLEEITGLYIKLDKLDYIGRKPEKDIFVKEDKRKKKPKKKNRINFLAQE